MPHVSVATPSSETRQQDENGGVCGQPAIVPGDPIDGDGAAVRRPQALAAEREAREGAEEGGEDGLNVAVPCEDGEGFVGFLEGAKVEEAVAVGADELEVEGGRGGGHGAAAGGEEAGGAGESGGR